MYLLCFVPARCAAPTTRLQISLLFGRWDEMKLYHVIHKVWHLSSSPGDGHDGGQQPQPHRDGEAGQPEEQRAPPRQQGLRRQRLAGLRLHRLSPLLRLAQPGVPQQPHHGQVRKHEQTQADTTEGWRKWDAKKINFFTAGICSVFALKCFNQKATYEVLPSDHRLFSKYCHLLPLSQILTAICPSRVFRLCSHHFNFDRLNKDSRCHNIMNRIRKGIWTLV